MKLLQDIKYPVYEPIFFGNEKKYVMNCLDTSWISSKGEYINLFENSFANFINITYATSVCNGTIALDLALMALGIGPGDEVIVPTLTYVASANSIVHVGATPVFVDSKESHWQMDTSDVIRKITPKTRAIMAVHLYGHPCDIIELKKICTEYGLFLIEDCAEAIGTYYQDKHVGTFGDIATFSFYGNKTITTGEGGMVVTNDEELYKRSYHIKTQGLVQDAEYWHDTIGYNYRMTNICAAIGLAQLENINLIIRKKRNIAELYKKNIKTLNLPIQFHEEIYPAIHSYWMFSIMVSKKDDKENLRFFLKNKGIETRPVFHPIHKMPMYNKRYAKFPVAESISERGINLPSSPNLSDNDISTICNIIHEYYKSN
ncbi:DegT/DnrJ/EryC1/StrS aminotransferase [Methanospirillum hungatei JF-1]|uniref:DegT/DnrJ/EryC1/StrS aminotransferase n=1 Tax=Methanospirillum hungatei JF-1 (strain ATCC 27890 / DSM 864 / NBRC 100397 / JF-1) TaxID=323259 RepID=Q2FN94_METHJ|nr:DegT/DnrJ/EryC1/StrS aminotransferase family protein [Methanospirillum hungatei]ABD41833.1 DegT/DnrJ/EryC1/StrS aminotransferase [Methanospirillum hungatei JF-1]